MNGFEFASSCPRCGGSLSVVTIGRPVGGTSSNAVVRCLGCPSHIAEWVVLVRMLPVNDHRPAGRPPGRPGASCGTTSGWKKHLREGTEPCQECREAHRVTVAASKRRQRQWVTADV